jgi:hypothetical protein
MFQQKTEVTERNRATREIRIGSVNTEHSTPINTVSRTTDTSETGVSHRIEAAAFCRSILR